MIKNLEMGDYPGMSLWDSVITGFLCFGLKKSQNQPEGDVLMEENWSDELW